MCPLPHGWSTPAGRPPGASSAWPTSRARSSFTAGCSARSGFRSCCSRNGWPTPTRSRGGYRRSSASMPARRGGCLATAGPTGRSVRGWSVTIASASAFRWSRGSPPACRVGCGASPAPSCVAAPRSVLNGRQAGANACANAMRPGTGSWSSATACRCASTVTPSEPARSVRRRCRLRRVHVAGKRPYNFPACGIVAEAQVGGGAGPERPYMAVAVGTVGVDVQPGGVDAATRGAVTKVADRFDRAAALQQRPLELDHQVDLRRWLPWQDEGAAGDAQVRPCGAVLREFLVARVREARVGAGRDGVQRPDQRQEIELAQLLL